MMKALVTGANGFIGKNLLVHLRERGVEPLTFVRGEPWSALGDKVGGADVIFHLAGVNRPKTAAEFAEGNTDLTNALCDAVVACGRPVPVLFSSSIQAGNASPYGTSKLGAEEALRQLGRRTGAPVYIYRLPNVFGKWARPDYNSAVATFCHNIARDLPVRIHDPAAVIRLVYVDDVLADFLRVMDTRPPTEPFRSVEPVYAITVGELAQGLRAFKEGRSSLTVERVGTGLTRALYATFVSYLTPEQFAYPLHRHEDARGVFVEMLRTRDSGQISFFSAHPGVTRGGHYHHTKTEKFLVIQGHARFRFRHVDTGAVHEHFTSAASPEVVETIPGWSHDVTNVGSDEMIVMLWANESFDPRRPDTVAHPV